MEQFVIQNYKDGIYTAEQLKKFVRTSILTSETFEQVTGLNYETLEPLN